MWRCHFHRLNDCHWFGCVTHFVMHQKLEVLCYCISTIKIQLIMIFTKSNSVYMDWRQINAFHFHRWKIWFRLSISPMYVIVCNMYNVNFHFYEGYFRSFHFLRNLKNRRMNKIWMIVWINDLLLAPFWKYFYWNKK